MRRLIPFFMCLVCASCASQPRPAASTPAATAAPQAPALTPPSWDSYIDQLIEGYLASHPSFAVRQGRHEFDGRLPDWSPAGLQEQLTWLDAQREKLAHFAPESLSEEQRFQRDYVRANLDSEVFFLRELRVAARSPMYYLGAGLDPSVYVNTPYAPIAKRAEAFIAYLEKVPTAVAQMRANLELPLPRTFVDYSVVSFTGMAEFYRKDALLAFAEATDPALQSRLRAAVEPAARAMSEVSSWFGAQTNFSEQGYVLGTERFKAMLEQTEGVTTALEELEAIGRADLQRNLDALAAACIKYAPKASLQSCVDKLNRDKPKGGAVEGARAQLSELRSFVVEREIVSISGTEEAKVAEAPAYQRQNFAYIDIPGPYENNLPSVYYIAPPDPRWSKAEQDAYVPGKADLLFTSVHEVWPGHFLQFLHSNRASWRFGQLFVGYAFAEGWAHYAEELVVEEGLADNAPDLQIGQISNALLRNVRFLCAIGLHTQGLTVAQCEQMFKDQAYQDVGNARQQASRGTYDPAYLNYTMGKLMIRKLRADWKAENPGRPLREFHDAFLAHGGPPIPLLRARLLKDPSGSLF
ncbi:MAG TPA: DUF885 domain-containing protein [Polyangiales bacterium]|nr:DUF885 domain-containing protein [Polyangiales bacterium]